jgi:hypothetical protein
MEVKLGRLLATGNAAEIFEWGSRVMKVYKSSGAKRAAFHEAAGNAAVEALGLPVPRIWVCMRSGIDGDYRLIG